MRSLVYLLKEIGKALLLVCAVALPAIAAWGLFFIVFYHAKFSLAGSFWYLGIGALAWLFLCWRSPQPHRTLSDLLLGTVLLLVFMVAYTLVRRITARHSADAREIVFLIATGVLAALALGVAFWRRLRNSPGSNQSLQPTAGRSDEQVSDDFNTKLGSKARSRQRWLSLFSLGV
jgi:drug/metabolite transporter (DMT)-like permease